MDQFIKSAIEEAQKGLDEGGIPIGSVLVIDGKIVGRGRNVRSWILRHEMNSQRSLLSFQLAPRS